MNKIATVICAAALTAASFATAQEYTAPVAPEVSQADGFGGGLNSAATWTAAGVVIVGAVVVDNQQSNATGTNASSTN